MAKVKDELLDHNYDGIQEYDNPMPKWWVYLFIFTIIWGVLYIYYYHIAEIAGGQEEEYMSEVLAAEMNVKTTNVKFDYKLLTKPEELTEGRAIFEKNCVSCHGSSGEGAIGPNLTDQYWIHGGGFDNVVKTTINGVPAKSMIAWKTILRPADIQKVASYVISLAGTNPPNAKVPQGDLYEE